MSDSDKAHLKGIKDITSKSTFNDTSGERNVVIKSKDQQAWSWCAKQEKSQDYCFKVVVDVGPSLIGNATKAWSNVVATGLASEANMKENTKIIADHMGDAAKESIEELKKRQEALAAISNAADSNAAMTTYQKSIGAKLGAPCKFTDQCQAAGSIYGSGSGEALDAVNSAGQQIGSTSRLTTYCYFDDPAVTTGQQAISKPGTCQICTPPRPKATTNITETTTFAKGQYNVQRDCMCIEDSDCAVGRGGPMDYSWCDNSAKDSSLTRCAGNAEAGWTKQKKALKKDEVAAFETQIAAIKAFQEGQRSHAHTLQKGCDEDICQALMTKAAPNPTPSPTPTRTAARLQRREPIRAHEQ